MLIAQDAEPLLELLKRQIRLPLNILFLKHASRVRKDMAPRQGGNETRTPPTGFANRCDSIEDEVLCFDSDLNRSENADVRGAKSESRTSGSVPSSKMGITALCFSQGLQVQTLKPDAILRVNTQRVRRVLKRKRMRFALVQKSAKEQTKRQRKGLTELAASDHDA